MSDAAARFRAFLVDAPHWVELLSEEPARNVLRRDTSHPVFHGCLDWHSACHGVWALIAHRGITGDCRHAAIVDQLLTEDALAREAADLAARPDFEMPYGRAWFLRLALEDARVGGATRLAPMARSIAADLVARYEQHPPEPFAREYRNASWALTNLFDYAKSAENREILQFAHDAARALEKSLDVIPDGEAQWPDFMAVLPALCELLVRVGSVDASTVLGRARKSLFDLRPVLAPTRAHHHALNFSRAWSLLALFEATDDDGLLSLGLDHLEAGLAHPSWWRGDYRAVGHWVPQFGIFALQRAFEVGSRWR